MRQAQFSIAIARARYRRCLVEQFSGAFLMLQSRWYKSGWTDERRAKQREAIQRWKPWEKSTGPKTSQGKAQAALNAYGAYLSRLPMNKFLAEIERWWSLEHNYWMALEFNRISNFKWLILISAHSQAFTKVIMHHHTRQSISESKAMMTKRTKSGALFDILSTLSLICPSLSEIYFSSCNSSTTNFLSIQNIFPNFAAKKQTIV